MWFRKPKSDLIPDAIFGGIVDRAVKLYPGDLDMQDMEIAAQGAAWREIRDGGTPPTPLGKRLFAQAVREYPHDYVLQVARYGALVEACLIEAEAAALTQMITAMETQNALTLKLTEAIVRKQRREQATSNILSLGLGWWLGGKLQGR